MRWMLVCSLAVALMILGCGKDGDKGAGKTNEDKKAKAGGASDESVAPKKQEMTTHDLTEVGAKMTTPKTWTVLRCGGGGCTFKLPQQASSGGVMIMANLAVIKTPMKPKSLDEEAKKCEMAKGKVGIKEALPNGGVLYTCATQAAGQTMKSVEAMLPLPDEGALVCQGSGLDDMAPLVAACKSLTPTKK